MTADEPGTSFRRRDKNVLKVDFCDGCTPL